MDANYQRLRRATQSVSEYPGRRVETTWTVDKTEGAFKKRRLRKALSNPEEYHTKKNLESTENKDERCGLSHPEMNNGKSTESTEFEEVQHTSLSYFSYLGDERNSHRIQFYEMYGLSKRSSVKVNPNLQMIQENVFWKGSQPESTNESWFSDPRADDNISVTEYHYMNAIDCCTCMCCVRGLIYHLTKDDGNEGNLELCNCTEPSMNCLIQWSIIGLVTIFMPCLVLYPFLKGSFKIYKYFKRRLKKKQKIEKILHYKK